MEEVKIPITIDDSGFSNGTNRIIDRMHDTQKEVNKTGMSVDDFSKRLQEVCGRLDKLTAAVQDNTAAINQDSHATKQLGHDLDETTEKGVGGFSRLEKAAVGFFTIQKAKDFIGVLYDTYSEVEKLRASFHILAGEQGEALFESIRKFTANTPMLLKDFANAAETMMGFGIAAEDVMRNLEAIGDVSRGNSQNFQSLALAFSQMSATGKLMGQDFLQMVNAGFNPLDQMAKTTGKSVAELKDEMSNGAISADMVRQAFIDATSEGGKFNGMLEAQSKTLAGANSNLQGVIDDMLTDIGQKNEGVMMSAIEGTTALVRNYEKVAEVIQDLIVVYGSYKAALMVCNAVENTSVAVKRTLTSEVRRLATARGISVAAARAELGNMNLLTVAKIRLTAATKSLTTAMMANPYVLVAAAVSGLVFGVYKLATAEDAETAARKRANEEMQTFEDKLDAQKNKIQSYIQTLQDSNATEYQKAEAWEMLNKFAPTLTEKYDRATLSTMDLAKANKELNEEMDGAKYDHIVEKISELNKTIDELEKRQKSTGQDSSFYVTNARDIMKLQGELEGYESQLGEIIRIRKKMEEDNTPLEIRIKEANGNVEAKAEIYDFYKRAADLAGELKTAHDTAANTISDSSIPMDYDTIAEGVRQKYEDLINDLEKDVEDLRGKIANSPASVELEKELKGKEQVLADLLQMKRDWDWSGATTIPLNFQVNFSQVEQALKDAQNGLGKNTEGMKWVKDSVTLAGGHWEKDDAKADTKTAAQWRKNAYNSWKTAQKAVDDFWQRKESMDKVTFDKEYERLKAEADKAKKDYDSMKGAKATKSSQAAKDAANRRVQITIEERRWSEELQSMEQQASEARTAADIAAIEDDGERERAARDAKHARALREIDKQGEEMKKAVYEHNKKIWEARNKDKHYETDNTEGRKGWQGASLTPAQQEQLRAMREKENSEYTRLLQQRQRDEEQSMRDYLSKYGEYEERKLAITQSYEAKIAKAQTAGEKKSLGKELEAALADLDMEELKKGINWEEVFGDLDKVSTDGLKSLRDRLKDYISTQKGLQPDALKELVNAVEAIGDKVSERNPFSALSTSLVELQGVTDKVRFAQDIYNKALEDGTEEEIRNAKATLDAARNAKQKALAESTDALHKSVSEVRQYAEAANDLTGLVSNLGINPPEWLEDYLDGVSQTLDGLESIDLSKPMSVVTGGIKALSGAVKTITSLGGIVDWNGSNAKEVAKTTERLTEANEHLKVSIDGLKDEISKSVGVSSIASAREALDAQKKYIENQREILKAQQGYHGAHHSNNYYWNLDAAMQGEINRLLAEWASKNGSTASRVGKGWSSFASLSPEEMDYIRKHDAELWAKLTDIGKYDKSEYFNEFADLAGSMKEITDSLNEALTGTSADNVFDDFLNSLYELADGSEDEMDKIADNWQQMVNRMAVNNIVGGQFQTDLKKWYENLARLNEQRTNGLIGDDEYKRHLDDLKNEYDGYVKNAESQLDQLRGMGIIQPVGIEGANNDFFSGLRQSFLTTLSSMEGDAKDWNKEITKIMVEDLINTQVLGESFEKWMSDWRERYAKAMASGDTSGTDKLREELMSKREELAGAAQDIMDSMGYSEMVNEADGAFSDLHSSFLDTLTDMNTDAEEWSKKITQTMVEQLIEQNILNDAFDTQLDDWRERFANVVKDSTLSDAEREASLKALRSELEAMRESLSGEAQKFMDSLGYGEMMAEKDESPFTDLRKNFIDTLTNMKSNAADWRKSLNQTFTKSLIDKFVLGADFDSYLEDWNERYLSTLNDAAKGQEEIESTLDAMIEELVNKREEMLEEAENLRDKLAEQDTTFTGMRDNWLSALMDMKNGTENFMNDVRELLTQKMVEKFVMTKDFDSWLDEFQTKYNAVMGSGMNEQEMAAAMARLAAEWETKTIEMNEMTDRIFDITGWSKLKEEMNSPLSDLRCSFVSSLTDMEGDALDFGKNISKILTEAFVDKFVLGDEFEERLAEWQEQYAGIMGGNYSDEDRARLLKNLQEAISAAKAGYAEEANAIQDLMGLGSHEDQNATMSMAEAATYDQFETYLGIAVAQQMATIQGNEVRQQILQTLRGITGITSPDGDTVREIRSLLGTANEYLLDLKRSNRAILNQFGEKLDTIISRLKYIF